MATLTIRNLPEAVHDALKRRAKRNQRTLNQEVIAELSRAAAREDPEEQRARVDGEIRRIHALRARVRGFLTAKEIDDAKRSGRTSSS